jgi:hypothetical protein
VPEEPAAAASVGVRAAGDGTAWIVPPAPGLYRLSCNGASQAVRVRAVRGPRTPGYGDVERIEWGKGQ